MQSGVQCNLFWKARRLRCVFITFDNVARRFSISADPKQSINDKDALKTPFRCLEHNPVSHTHLHSAQFYRISQEDHKRLFSHGGLTRDFQQQVKTFNECCLMVRQPALEVFDYLRSANYANPVVRYALYGRNGTGKTLTLAHILHFCATQNWMLAHVPWAPFWTRMIRESTQSLYKPGRYDLPVDAVSWLQQFMTHNIQLLQSLQLKTMNKYTWSKREITEEGSPITDLIELGVNRVKYSSDCVGAICKELKLHSSQGKFKLLVAIDGVNAFFYPTRIKRDDKSIVPPSDVTLIRAFIKLMRNDWTNGAVVLVIDPIAAHSDHRSSHFPRYLLGKEGFEILDPFVPVLMDNYSPKEIESCLDYYIDRLWIQSKQGRTEEGRKELIFLSGHNPLKLIEICGSW